jgi:hypothetical protein
MGESGKIAQQSQGAGGILSFLWQRKLWLLLPLCVLFLLLGIIYALGHFSRTDSEMYPTTMRQSEFNRCVS